MLLAPIDLLSLISPSCSDNKATVGCGAAGKFHSGQNGQPMASMRHRQSGLVEKDAAPLGVVMRWQRLEPEVLD